MIDFDPDHVLGAGEHFVDDDPWSIRQQREADVEYARAMAALQRRERRERLAREIAVVKAVEKAGLPVRRAVIDGVDLEFGQPEPKAAPDEATINPWDKRYATQ
jgi:glyoxylase-like metal-dependent hydrolase (beta-lactamase superfamily II)